MRVCTGRDTRRIWTGKDAQIHACDGKSLQLFPDAVNTTLFIIKPKDDKYLSQCMCVVLLVLVTSWCSGGELRVKMKRVFRSSDGGFKWRPHLLLVQPLYKK